MLSCFLVVFFLELWESLILYILVPTCDGKLKYFSYELPKCFCMYGLIKSLIWVGIFEGLPIYSVSLPYLIDIVSLSINLIYKVNSKFLFV